MPRAGKDPSGAVGATVAETGTVAIETHGCKLNQADSAVLAQEFAHAGYRLVERRRDADIIVVNTCTVTATADSKARQALRAAHRANPAAVVVAAGCYPERRRRSCGASPKCPWLWAIGRNPTWWQWPYPRAPDAGGLRLTPGVATTILCRSVSLRRSRAMVKIQEGCDQVCAYCIVPKVRGRERSIRPAEIVHAVQRYVAAGFKEITLTGTQLGTYGFDLDGENLPGLLDRILGETDLPRLRVSRRCRPTKSTRTFWRVGKTRACARTSHVPLQSGSDSVLRAMRRRYDTDTFRRAVEDHPGTGS